MWLIIFLVLWKLFIDHSHIVKSLLLDAQKHRHTHRQRHTHTKKSKVRVRGQRCVGHGWENNGWGILAAENSTPCPSSHSSLAQHVWHRVAGDRERGPRAFFSLRQELLTGLLTDTFRGGENAIESWQCQLDEACQRIRVCFTDAMCCKSESQIRDYIIPPRVQELIYWLWHCHMSASECHGKFQQQLWRYRSCARFTLISSISADWYL